MPATTRLVAGGVFGSAGGLTAGTSLDGGVGTDIINITDGATYNAANLGFVKNFETLDLSGATGTFDASVATGTGAFTAFQADAGIGGTHGALTLTNIANGFLFSEISAKSANETVADTFTLKTNTANDSAIINLTSVDGNNNGTAQGQLNATLTFTNAVENVTLNATVSAIDTGLKASNYVDTVSVVDAGLKVLTITGNESINLSTTSGGSITTVNAAASTGDITYNFGGVTKVSYAGSAGVDTITFGDGGTFFGGASNDQVTLNATHANNNVLVFKAGTDASLTTSGTVVATTSTTETYTNFQSISDATKAGTAGHDTIDVSGIGGFTGFADGVKTIAGGVDPLGGTFAAQQANFFNDVGGNRGVAVEETGTKHLCVRRCQPRR